MNNLLELIDIKKIIGENIVPLGEETIRRYFRRGVFHIHKRNPKDGTTILSYRGSVFIRYRVFEKIARQNSLRRISIEDMGDVMTKASGYEDDFILNRIQKEIPKDQIIKEYSDEVKKALARKKI